MKNYAEKCLSNWKKFLFISLLFKTIQTTTSSPKIQPDTDDFQTLILNRNLYVDKTQLILEYLKLLSRDVSPLLIVQRPEGWTKSTNMKMLEKFLEIEVDNAGNPLPPELTINEKLFLGGSINGTMLNRLKISNSTIALRHLGQHPVILLRLKKAIGNGYEDIVRGIRSCIMEAYKKHEYLSSSSKITDKTKFKIYLDGEFGETELIKSIYFLSEKLYQHFDRKVHVFVDDYDVPFVYAALNNDTVDYLEIGKLLQNLLENSLTKNRFRSVALMNAVYPVNLTWNNKYHLVDTSFIEYYGFNQIEVEKLLEDSKTEINSKTLKNWYGGYYVNGKADHYNARSVMRFLAENGTNFYFGPSIDTSCPAETSDYDYSEQTITDNIFNLLTAKILLKNIDGLLRILMKSNFKSSQCPNSNSSLEDCDADDSWSEDYSKEKETLLYNGLLTTYQNLVPIASSGSLSISSDSGISAEELLALEKLQVQFLDYLIPNNEMAHFYHMMALQWIYQMFEIPQDFQFNSFVQLIRFDRIRDFISTLRNYVSKPKVNNYIQSESSTSDVELYNAFIMSLKITLSATHTMNYEDLSEQIAPCQASAYGHTTIFTPKNSKTRLNDTIVIDFDILDKRDQDFHFNTQIENAEKINFHYNRTASILKKNLNTDRYIYISLVFCGQYLAAEYAVRSPKEVYNGLCDFDPTHGCEEFRIKYD